MSGAAKTRPAHGPTLAATGWHRRLSCVFAGSLWSPAPDDQGRGQPEAGSTGQGTGPQGLMPWFASDPRIVPIRAESSVILAPMGTIPPSGTIASITPLAAATTVDVLTGPSTAGPASDTFT